MADEPDNLVLKILQELRGEMQSMRSSLNAIRLNQDALRAEFNALRAEFQSLRDEMPILIRLEVGNAMRPFMDRLEKLEA